MEAGCSPKGLQVLGHPGLDQLRNLEPPPPSAREKIPPNRNTEFILYISSALALFPTQAEKRGFPDHQAVHQLAEVAAARARRQNRPIFLGLKAHPREDPAVIDEWTRSVSHPGLTVQRIEGDRLVLPRIADRVVGTLSILLIESVLLGAHVISFQPSRKIYFTITDNRPGLSVVTATDDLAKALDKPKIAPPDPSDLLSLPDNACDRFLAFIEDGS